MLILSRKKDESIIIGGNIEIKILEIHESKVRIGIKAPQDIDIFREELYKSIQEENIEASKPNIDINEMNQIFKKKIQNRR